MGYAQYLAYSGDDSLLDSLIKYWPKFSDTDKNKIAALKLHEHFIEKDYFEILRAVNRIDDSRLSDIIRDYVMKADGNKLQQYIFGVKEWFRNKILKKPMQYDMIEAKLDKLARKAYPTYLELVKNLGSTVKVFKKRYLKELSKQERHNLILQKNDGEELDSLVRQYHLADRTVIYQAATQYNQKKKREYISLIKDILHTNEYDSKDIFSMINKIHKRTFGELSDDEKQELNRLNKLCAVRAQDLAERFRLSGKHVVYLANRWVKESKANLEPKQRIVEIPVTQQYVGQSVYVH